MDIPPNNNVLEKFQHTLDKNPLMGLKFDGPIHKAISKHFGQSHVSPFNNIELGTTYAAQFYFHIFFGLLAAACMESERISSTHVVEFGGKLQLFVLYGERVISHTIFLNELIGGDVVRPTSPIPDEILTHLFWKMTKRGFPMYGFVNYEYDLVPKSTNVEERTGIKMILKGRKEYESRYLFFNIPKHFPKEYGNIKEIPLPNSQLRKSYEKFKSAKHHEPHMIDLIRLARYVMMTPGSSIPSEYKSAQTAGYLHGLSYSALPHEYYKKVFEARYPAIHSNTEGMQLYFPATNEMPNEHLILDTNINKIKKHTGYDVFNQLTNVGPKTKIVEIYESGDRSLPVTGSELRWSIKDIALKLDKDISLSRYRSSPSDVEMLKQNIEHYSETANKILNPFNLRGLNDVKAFLMGNVGSMSNREVKISKSNEQFIDALYVKGRQLNPSLCMTFNTNEGSYPSVDELIKIHSWNDVLGMNFKFTNGKLSFQPFSMTETDAANAFSFSELPTFSLKSPLREMTKISAAYPETVTPQDEIQTRKKLQEGLHSVFRQINELSIPEDSIAAFTAGVFQQSKTVRFGVHKGPGTRPWNILAEMLSDRRIFKFYIQLFRSETMEARATALSLRTIAEKDAFAVAYNLAKNRDELAVMALSKQLRYLNSDEVETLCSTSSRRKRRAAVVGYCGLRMDEKVPTTETERRELISKTERINYENIEYKVAEKFPNLREHISMVHELCGKVQLGFIGRDIIGGLYRGDLKAVASSTFFFGTAVASSKVGSTIAKWGKSQISLGKKVVGRFAEFFGKCLPKIGFDIYMGNQLYDEWKHNDTESAKYTAAYIGIDLLECGLEALEAFGVISSGAILSGALAVIGTSILIAQNVMQTSRKIQEINAVIPLTTDEKIYEINREFFLFGTDKIIQSMIDETTANEVVVRQILQQYPDFGRFLVSAAAKVNEDGSLIFIEDNTIDLTRVYHFHKSRLMPRSDIIGENVTAFCAMNEAFNPLKDELDSSTTNHRNFMRYVSQGASMAGQLRLPERKAYSNSVDDFYCKNAFGIADKSQSETSSTLFLLFNGTDDVIGFPTAPNVFLLLNGNKSINGGSQNDQFFIKAEYIFGHLNGLDGEDVADFSASDAGKDLVIRNGEAFFNPMHSNIHTLKLYHIENIIGRSSLTDYIEVCNETKVDLGGATYGLDRINLTNSCGPIEKNLTIVLRKNTFVTCNTQYIVQYIVVDESDTELVLMAGKHQFQIDSVQVKNVIISGENHFRMMSFGSAKVRIQADDLSNVTFFFKKENLTMKIDGQNVTLYLHKKQSIFDIVEKYAEYIENNLHIKLIAESDHGTIVLNHNFFMVDFEGKTSLLNVVSNGHKSKVQLIGHKSVENYFAISLEDSAIGNDYINITIQPHISESLPCYIDLHDLTRRMHIDTEGIYGLYVVPQKVSENIKLLIHAVGNNQSLNDSSVSIGEVNIIGGYKYLNQITVYLYGKNRFYEGMGMLRLEPSVIFISSSIASISPGNFEFNSKIRVTQPAINLTSYRVEDTLLLTNIVPMEEASHGQPTTLSLIDFFRYKAKYQTLTLSFENDDLDLTMLARKVQNIRSMWMDISETLDDP